MGLRPGKARAADVGIDQGAGGRPGYEEFINTVYPGIDSHGTSITNSRVINQFRYAGVRFRTTGEDASLQLVLHPNFDINSTIGVRMIGWDRQGVAGTYTFDYGLRIDPDQTNLPAINMPDAFQFISDGTANKFYYISLTPTIQGTPSATGYVRIQMERTDSVNNDDLLIAIHTIDYDLA